MADLAPVAVVIPVYNRRLKLIKTVASVAAQTKLPALLVIVDDGSSDGSADMVEAWLTQHAPFAWKVMRQANTGVAGARNAGFAESGDFPFVCFPDSADIWRPDYLAESLSRVREPGVRAAAAWQQMPTSSTRWPPTNPRSKSPNA